MSEHNHDHHHSHDHTHGGGADHRHDAGTGADHHHDGHAELLQSREEAAAFLTFTLQHNAHHEEELAELAHSLQHLSLDTAAAELASCVDALREIDGRLQAVLAGLK